MAGTFWDRFLLHAHLERVGTVLLALDAAGRVTSLNRRGHELLEYADGELVGKDWFETCVPQSDREGAAAAFRQLLAQGAGGTACFDARLLTKSGAARIVAWHASVLSDEAGNGAGILGSGEDVTQSRSAERAVRESEELLRTICDNINDIVVKIDLQGTYLYVSPSHERILGRGAEVLGTCCFDYIHPDDREATWDAFVEGIRTGVECRQEHRYSHPAKGWIWLESVGQFKRMRDGEPIAVVASRDITERKHAEEEIQKLALVVRYSSELVCLASLDGRRTFLNEAGSRILGIAPDDAGQHAMDDIIPQELRAKVHGEVLPTILERGMWEGDLQYRNVQTGRCTDVHAMTFAVRDARSGKPLYFANVSLDITERKRAQDALCERLREIERFNRLAMARELRVAALKARVNELSRAAGLAIPYQEPEEHSGPASEAGDAYRLAPPAQRSGHARTYSLEELLDRDQMQRLLDSYCDAVGISAAIIDLEGKIFVGARWRQICTDFHRVNPRTCARCIESDTRLANKLREGERFSLYQCHNGLTDAASPIVIEGRHVANVFVGQFLQEPADEDAFRRQAVQFGFDEAAYLDALADVPVIPARRMPAILGFLTSCARLVGQISLERLRARDYQVDLRGRAAELDRANRELRQQREAALSLAEDAQEAQAAAERAQQSLRDSEERFRTMTTAALDAIVMMDQQGRISFWNQAAEALFGHSAEEALGRNLHELLAPTRYQGAFRQGLAAFRGTGNGPAIGKTLELAALHRDGRELPVELSVTAVQLQGQWQALGIIRDISARRRAQQLLQQAKEAAEAASQAKSEFLANMSHEIRTPLTAILGYSDLLLDSPGSPAVQEAAQVVKRNGEHLLSIINDILDLSKIEAGRLEPELTRCSPRQIVAEIAALMRVRADAKGLRIAVDCRGPVPETICTDPVRLRQILANLLGNAVKFTDRGGVRIRVQLLPHAEPGPMLQFDVVDTGIGLAADQIEQLFQPFTQADASTQRRFGGTGLGLASSKRLTEMLGGSIAVASTPGQGSTFTLTLPTGPLEGVPLIDTAAPALVPAQQKDLRGVKLACRILLAEDGPDNQRLIALVLRKAGAEVVVADNGRAAVDLVADAARQGRPFDLVLMDMQMPVMDGYEATRWLRSSGCTVPIVALTAHAMKDDRQRCLAAGCDRYAAKPIQRAELLHVVAECLGGPTATPAADAGTCSAGSTTAATPRPR